MVQGSILSPIPPILYIIYIYIYYYSLSFLPLHKGISIHLFTFSLAFILCLVWCEDRIVYSFMPFSFESMYRLVWGCIGISMFFFSLLLFSIWLSLFRYEDNQNIYSFIYPTYLLDSVSLLVWGGIGISTFLPEPPPYLGQGYTIWYKYRTIPQLNKIRILFNSLPFHTHIYTYTTVYHCIPCIHRTAYPLHLPLKPDYHTMHKRIQARICPTAYTSTHSQAPEHGRTMQGKARKSADIGRSSTRYIWYISPSLLPKNIEKIVSITVSHD